MSDIVIVAAKRTAIGNLCGGLASMSAQQLGAAVIADILCDSKVVADDVSEVIMGQALSAGCGQNPARQAAILAGLPSHIPAMTINKVCGSGLKSVALGYQSILLGENDIVVAGGQESMSQAPHVINMRTSLKLGDATMKDSAEYDGLTDAFNHYHMGVTAENLVKKYSISRNEQDNFAFKSQKKAAAAQKAGVFKQEITSIMTKMKKEEKIIDTDEFPKHNTTLEGLAPLKPAFISGGTVTAGNSSGLNDGASALLLMRESLAVKKGLTPLAHIVSCACSGVDPEFMGIGPVFAINKALARAKWVMRDLDLIELNEAFAAQAIAVTREAKLNSEIMNVNGGAIALGHPIGSSGARCLVTLLYEMQRRKAHKGLVSLCIGGGMGIAMCVSKCH